MTCSECGCASVDAPGWIALLYREVDEDDESAGEVLAFCPPCAHREFELATGAASGYI